MITKSICLRQEKDLVDNRTSLCSSIPLSLEGRYALLDKEWRKRYFYSDLIIGFIYNHDTLPSNCAQCPPDYISLLLDHSKKIVNRTHQAGSKFLIK